MTTSNARCHKCGLGLLKDTARLEWCDVCGYTFYYGDAHAPAADARQSRELDPGGRADEAPKED